MWQIINRLVESGITILLTTQYLEEADQLAQKVAILDEGKIIAQGTSKELKAQVGEERLELTLRSSHDLEKAAAALGGQGLQIDTPKRTIRLAIDEGVGGVKRVLDQLERAGIAIESLSLHKPTLDDVFLRLTGHKAEQEIVEEDGQTP